MEVDEDDDIEKVDINNLDETVITYSTIEHKNTEDMSIGRERIEDTENDEENSRIIDDGDNVDVGNQSELNSTVFEDLQKEMMVAKSVEDFKGVLGGMLTMIQTLTENKNRNKKKIKDQELHIESLNKKIAEDANTIRNLQEQVFHLSAELTMINDGKVAPTEAKANQEHVDTMNNSSVRSKGELSKENLVTKKKKASNDKDIEKKIQDIRDNGKVKASNIKLEALLEDTLKLDETVMSIIKKVPSGDDIIQFGKRMINLNTKHLIRNGTITKVKHLSKITSALLNKLNIADKVSLVRFKGFQAAIIHFPLKFEEVIDAALRNGGADVTPTTEPQIVKEERKHILVKNLAYTLLKATTINLRTCVLEGFSEDIQEDARRLYEELKSANSLRASPRL
jgi:uncharacterized coiled-coil protein SlyX